jgi:hypothetical protein
VEERAVDSPAEGSGAVAAGLPVPDVLLGADAPCEECRGALGATYYLANGHGLCVACEARLQGSYARAVTLGLLAAIGCVALYYAVYAAIGMRFVFITVLAGVAVGAAVRKGAHASQLLRHRWAAVVLTYLAAAATYAHSLLDLPEVHGHGDAIVRSLYLPVLMVIQQKNIVTLILLAFGLHEAWKFSGPPRVRIEGPYRASQ